MTIGINFDSYISEEISRFSDLDYETKVYSIEYYTLCRIAEERELKTKEKERFFYLLDIITKNKVTPLCFSDSVFNNAP